MWNILSHIGSSEPKFTNTQKGGYHTSIPLMGPSLLCPVQDKRFSYMKDCCKKMTPITNYTTSGVKETRDFPEISSQNINNNNTNNKKKKKKRRRRKKKSKNQKVQEICQNQKQSPPQRQRQLSTCSNDSFVIFFDGNKESDDGDNDTETEDFSSSDCVVPYKKVHFATELCEVHPMVAWSYAYQAARKGPWEEYARDRCRFKKRIENAESLIGHIFSKDHRSRIYEQRFS